MIPPKDKPANYEHWNQFPIVSIYEAIYLTIKINPKKGEPEERKNREKYRELINLAAAHLTFGSLKLFPKGKGIVQVSVWQAWLLTVGWSVPTEWKPIEFEQEEKQIFTGGPSYEKAVAAAIVMRDDQKVTTPATLNDLYQYMAEHDSSLNIDNFKRQVTREPGTSSLDNKNPLNDPRFLEETDNM